MLKLNQYKWAQINRYSLQYTLYQKYVVKNTSQTNIGIINCV